EEARPTLHRQPGDLLAGAYLPESGRAVEVTGGEERAVRREGNGMDLAFVALQAPPLSAGREIPQTDDSIVAGAGEQTAIGRLSETKHFALVSLGGEDLLPGGDVPDSDRRPAAHGEGAAVGGEGERAGRLAQAGDLPQLLAGGGAPEAHRPVAARRCQRPAVGRVHNRLDQSCV